MPGGNAGCSSRRTPSGLLFPERRDAGGYVRADVLLLQQEFREVLEPVQIVVAGGTRESLVEPDPVQEPDTEGVVHLVDVVLRPGLRCVPLQHYIKVGAVTLACLLSQQILLQEFGQVRLVCLAGIPQGGVGGSGGCLYPRVPPGLQLLEDAAHQVGGVDSPVAFVGNVVELEFLPAHCAACRIECVEVNIPVLAGMEFRRSVKFYG